MEDEPELWQDQQRLYNFLKHYDLLHYHKKFLEKGVRRLSHLKDVAADDASLDEIGLSRPERLRLRKKVKENVEWKGRIMVSENPMMHTATVLKRVNIVVWFCTKTWYTCSPISILGLALYLCWHT